MNKSHTERDRKAEEIANEEGRQTEEVPTPEGIWIIENEERLCIHSKIRKSTEKEFRNRICREYVDEKEDDLYKRADLRKAIGKVQTTNTETQDNWRKAIEGKCGSRGLKDLLKIRQNKLLLFGRLKEMGILVVQDDECIICAKKVMREGKQTEDLKHIWGNCGVGNEKKEQLTEEITEIIEKSKSGPEWQLLHEVKEEKAGIQEEKEDEKDPQTPGILTSFMYADLIL